MDSKISKDLRRTGGRKGRVSQRQDSWSEGGSYEKGLQGRIKLEAHVSRGILVWPLTVGSEVSNSSNHRMIGIFLRMVQAVGHCP